jgi:hypothetical protein
MERKMMMIIKKSQEIPLAINIKQDLEIHKISNI